MTLTLFAQPYNIDARGFYFESTEDYQRKARGLRDSYGNAVEEFEVQFIDGEAIDCALAKAIGLNQANFPDFLDCVDRWEDWQKYFAIIAYGELGYGFEPLDDPEDRDIDIYHVQNLRELAEEFVADGIMGEVPEHLQYYIDYDAIARDLAVDFTETTIADVPLVYRAS